MRGGYIKELYMINNVVVGGTCALMYLVHQYKIFNLLIAIFVIFHAFNVDTKRT